MKKNLINLAVATTLGLTALAVSAEDMYRGAWYAVPGVSVINPDNDLEADNSGAGAFIRLGKELSPSWDVQFGLGYAHSTNDLAGVSGRYKQTLLGADALYFFSRDQFRPFVLAGLGVARNKVDYSGINLDDKTKTSPFVNLGLGAQYLISDKFGLQADLRHVWSKAGTQSISPDNRLDADETVGNTYLNLGAIFRFGAPAPMPVAAMEEPAAPAPAPVAEMAPAPACTPVFETKEVSAEKLFEFNKSGISAEGKAELDDAANKIKANPSLTLVMVTGHTDRIGSDEYNQDLSQKRAMTVKEYLIAQGVDASRLESVGKGESEPVVACDDITNRAKLIECLQPNRRVVISGEAKVETGCN